MALKLDYVVRETTSNLRRNVTLTFAAIVTVGVSLALFGSALLLQAGVDNVSARWENGIELIVFLQRDATDDQLEALRTAFDDNPEIGPDNYRYVDLEESRAEARRLFERNDAMLQKIEDSEDLVPASFRIVPQKKDTEVINALARQFAGQPGVQRTTSSQEAVKTVSDVTQFSRTAILSVAVGLLVAALMLILNAIRMAMFARRREIEVMKLVGATNWFIRVPFMLEGIIHGLIGSLLALVGVLTLDRFMERVATNEEYRLILQGFVASPGERTTTLVIVVLLGMVIGAAGSGWALSRFLKV
ncbi:MAG TPA: permease-like cell division protein FtsX [Acidimicrobiales bacterium]|nr:permease-like cell division protein FtsX [Acidimicrobiales bacterium]